MIKLEFILKNVPKQFIQNYITCITIKDCFIYQSNQTCFSQTHALLFKLHFNLNCWYYERHKEREVRVISMGIHHFMVLTKVGHENKAEETVCCEKSKVQEINMEVKNEFVVFNELDEESQAVKHKI